MVSAIVSLFVVFVGSMSASCQAAPIRQLRSSDNSSVISSPGWPRSTQMTPKFFLPRNQEILPGVLRQLNKLEDRLKRISSGSLGSVLGKFHQSLSSIARLRDMFQLSNNKPHSTPTPSQLYPDRRMTVGRLNATDSSTGATENSSKNQFTTPETGDDRDGMTVTNRYESQFIRGSFSDWAYTTIEPSKQYINPYINVDSIHEAGSAHDPYLKINVTHKEHNADSIKHSNSYLKENSTRKEATAQSTVNKGLVDSFSSLADKKIVSGDETIGASHQQNNKTLNIIKMEEPTTVSNRFHDTTQHAEDIITFNKEEHTGDIIQEEYIVTKVFIQEKFRILTPAVQESIQEEPVDNNTTIDSDTFKRLFTPANSTGKLVTNMTTDFSPTDCLFESCNLDESTAISENITEILQRIIKMIETSPYEDSASSKLYVKRQTPDVLSFTSELTQDEEDSDETVGKDDYRDDCDEIKLSEIGKHSAGDIYGLQNSDNTFVASMKNAVNFTKEIELLDRTVGFYATTILELLPHVREGYLNNKFTEKEIETFKNMFGSMWTLINNTELIDNITRISNISDSEANEDIARAFREIETSGDKTLIRKTRSVSEDGKKSNKRHRHTSRSTGRKRSQRRKQTRTKRKEQDSIRAANKHRRKTKGKHVSVHVTDRPNRSRRRPRSHSVVNTTTVSEAAAILALLAEDGGSIQLDAPGEDEDYDEAYDYYAYDEDYGGGDPDYYKDEADESEDSSSELARYYNNDDDPSVRELITLASRHRDRKAKLQQETE